MHQPRVGDPGCAGRGGAPAASVIPARCTSPVPVILGVEEGESFQVGQAPPDAPAPRR